MPRPNKARIVEGEVNLARRIQIERELEGLSYESLARLMTDAGCPIQGSAIYKIEKGDPPRRITVDELIAFAVAFNTTVEDLLTPIELIRQEQGRQIAERLRTSLQHLYEAAADVSETLAAYFEIRIQDEELSEYIDNMWAAPQGLGWLNSSPTIRGRKVPREDFEVPVNELYSALVDLTWKSMNAASEQREED